ncbi:cache domain-containing sensor histidine kinase [Cellulosilyticum sp. I15G10I2]|uniref:cache domain-containing sensor histidine kinase n=1 Tax=Cellulosilyticum sp. I15G10I2 TaxID=1892843 RepID=UPI00085C1110|nr:sensor histidine kinase [Cellulosilyticum sp. I15G10I2]
MIIRFLKYSKNKIKALPLRYKLSYYMSLIVCVSAIVLGMLIYVLTSRSVVYLSQQLITQQLDQVSNNLQRFLDDITNSSVYTVYGDKIQTYLTAEKQNHSNYSAVVDEAYKALHNVVNSKSHLFYIYIKKELDQSSISVGPELIRMNLEREGMFQSPNEKVAYKPLISDFKAPPQVPREYLMSIHQPIYDVYHINKYRGFMYISILEETLCQYYSSDSSKYPLEIFIVNEKGEIISHPNKEKIATISNFIKDTKDTSELRVIDDQIVLSSYIKGWDWYVVGTIPQDLFYKDRQALVITIGLLLMMMITISIIISFSISEMLLKPFKCLIESMSIVSEGDFKVRLNLDTSGEDFKKVSLGFNTMVKKINELIQEVYKEQKQINEIELKVLREQINPHFLYNTLDCIHWQALMNGQKDISNTVKALATFYRKSLNRGEDLVPLKDELEHINNYSIIQNFRYSNILKVIVDVPDIFLETLLPKITLQPLIENSIYHGLKNKKDGDGIITISAYAHDTRLVIEVKDNGKVMSEETINSINQCIMAEDKDFGYGIRNVHKRIQLSFGEGYGLKYYANEQAGVIVCIEVPLTVYTQK